MIRSRFSKYVKAKVRMGIKYYVILRCSIVNSVLQISCVTLEERFSIDCKGLSFNQFSFSHLDPVSLFLFPLGRILLRMTHTAFFYRDRRRLQTIREKCVLLICDTFGVLWFLSLEYVIFLLF